MEFSDEDKEIGRKLFLGDCQFIKSCVSLDTLPSQNNSEVAFFGRSNVGKSSLINSLTNKKKLAKFKLNEFDWDFYMNGISVSKL